MCAQFPRAQLLSPMSIVLVAVNWVDLSPACSGPGGGDRVVLISSVFVVGLSPPSAASRWW